MEGRDRMSHGGFENAVSSMRCADSGPCPPTSVYGIPGSVPLRPSCPPQRGPRPATANAAPAPFQTVRQTELALHLTTGARVPARRLTDPRSADAQQGGARLPVRLYPNQED
jgi:hypothetical protein